MNTYEPSLHAFDIFKHVLILELFGKEATFTRKMTSILKATLKKLTRTFSSFCCFPVTSIISYNFVFMKLGYQDEFICETSACHSDVDLSSSVFRVFPKVFSFFFAKMFFKSRFAPFKGQLRN